VAHPFINLESFSQAMGNHTLCIAKFQCKAAQSISLRQHQSRGTSTDDNKSWSSGSTSKASHNLKVFLPSSRCQHQLLYAAVIHPDQEKCQYEPQRLLADILQPAVCSVNHAIHGWHFQFQSLSRLQGIRSTSASIPLHRRSRDQDITRQQYPTRSSVCCHLAGTYQESALYHCDAP
jgi:hypothetical protein